VDVGRVWYGPQRAGGIASHTAVRVRHHGPVDHPTTEDLLAGLDAVRSAPRDTGVLALIVRRPAVGERQILEAGELTFDDGLQGDGWRARGSRHTPDGSAEPGRQVTIMSARAIALVAGDRSRWPLAGDQLYIDIDLSEENLPAGTRLALGGAVLEISPEPHTGCAKFRERFGVDAARFVNGDEGRPLRLRGVNARVVEPGTIRVGDEVAKVGTTATALA
jgi:MOSC domain-containing protein YiiM